MYNGVERNILNTNDLTNDEKRSIIGQQIDLSEQEILYGEPILYNEDKLLFKEIGLIYSFKKRKFCGSFNNNGYVYDSIKDASGTYSKVRRNRLIYELCYNCKIPKTMHVNHINEVRHDNSISNLNLMTPKENCNHGHRNLRLSEAKSKPIVAYDRFTGEKVAEFPSAQIAANELGIKFNNISASCLRKRPASGGFIWRFASESIDKIDITEVYKNMPHQTKSHAA